MSNVGEGVVTNEALTSLKFWNFLHLSFDKKNLGKGSYQFSRLLLTQIFLANFYIFFITMLPQFKDKRTI